MSRLTTGSSNAPKSITHIFDYNSTNTTTMTDSSTSSDLCDNLHRIKTSSTSDSLKECGKPEENRVDAAPNIVGDGDGVILAKGENPVAKKIGDGDGKVARTVDVNVRVLPVLNSRKDL